MSEKELDRMASTKRRNLPKKKGGGGKSSGKGSRGKGSGRK